MGKSEGGGNLRGASVLACICRPRRQGRPRQLSAVMLALWLASGCSDHEKPLAATSEQDAGALVQQPVESKKEELPADKPAAIANEPEAMHSTAEAEGTTELDTDAGRIALPVDGVADENKTGSRGDDLVDAPPGNAGAGQVLDLGYKPDPAAAGGGLQATTADGSRKLLPDLFGKKVSDDGVSVSGGLLLDGEQERVRDSLHGAEVSVEIKTR